jgi:uncharacterized protein YnzC (UPF0291/DUF896 family)
MTPELIERINALTRLSRERELTPEEQEERACLRRKYIDQFKAGTRQTLENTLVKYPDGRCVPLKDACRAAPPSKRPERR